MATRTSSFDRALSDPVLRAAAHDLAAAPGGEITTGRGVRLAGWVALIEAAVMMSAKVFVKAGLSSPAGVMPVLPGA